MLRHEGVRAWYILGTPDDLKFQASMTLFDAAEPNAIWNDALNLFFAGQRHPGTLALIGAG